jgi:hypothetical protein
MRSGSSAYCFALAILLIMLEFTVDILPFLT